MSGKLNEARVGMTVENALTGEPLNVDAEIAPESIVVRVGDTLYVVHRAALTLEQARTLAAQLTRLTAQAGVS